MRSSVLGALTLLNLRNPGVVLRLYFADQDTETQETLSNVTKHIQI